MQVNTWGELNHWQDEGEAPSIDCIPWVGSGWAAGCAEQIYSLGWICCDAQAQPTPSTGGGGAPFVRRRLKKPKSFLELLKLQGDTEAFDVEIPPVPVEESAAGMRQEIARFEQAIEMAQLQAVQVEAEVDLLATSAALELLIRREILIRDLLEARQFILDLQEQAEILRLFKRRREEEEVILMTLMLEMDNMNITIH